jgi:hypothetical protein
MNRALVMLAWWCGIAHFAAFPAAASAKQCELKRLGSASFTVGADQPLLVSVTVNDRPATMELDLNRFGTMISSSYLKEFGLKDGRYEVLPDWDNSSLPMEFNGQRITRSTIPKSFSVGSQSFRYSELFVFPDHHPASSVQPPDIGRLSMDVLGAADFELDFANNRLNFYSHDHCPGVVVYWTDNYSSARMMRGPVGNYYFPMELDGKKVAASFSAIRQSSTLGTEVTTRLFGFDETSAGVETEIDGGGHVVARYRAMALTGPGITINNARVQLFRTPAPQPQAEQSCMLMLNGLDEVASYYKCPGSEAPLTLGLNVMRRLHLYFATKEHVLYFSDVAASK